ncbi:hypothetical protein SLA2020_497390 [Shorea laevis]
MRCNDERRTCGERLLPLQQTKETVDIAPFRLMLERVRTFGTFPVSVTRIVHVAKVEMHLIHVPQMKLVGRFSRSVAIG